VAGGVVAGVDDLFFEAKIQETARQLGVHLVVAGASQDVVGTVREQRPVLVILDLQSDACRPIETIRAIKSDPDLRATPVLGYYAHVRDELKAAATEAGCDQVLPRSALSARLPELLRRAVPSGAQP
jgi:CheY-like chemotaxis protein